MQLPLAKSLKAVLGWWAPSEASLSLGYSFELGAGAALSNMEGKEPENQNEDSVPLWPSGLSPLGSLGFRYPAVTTSLSQSSKKPCFFHFLRLHGGGGGL